MSHINWTSPWKRKDLGANAKEEMPHLALVDDDVDGAEGAQEDGYDNNAEDEEVYGNNGEDRVDSGDDGDDGDSSYAEE